jgi:hypothetical protein
VTHESEHSGATCDCARDPHCEQVNIGSGQSDADALDPWHGINEAFSELGLELVLTGETLANIQRLSYRSEHTRVIVAEDHWSHPARIVDVVVSIDVPQEGACRAGERKWHRTTRQADIGVHAASDHP